MIEEVLNREFVLSKLDEIAEELDRRSRSRRGGVAGPHEENISPSDYAAAADAVHDTLSAERKSADASAITRRGSQPTSACASQEERCFISGDPIVSITQSALEAFYLHPDSRTGLRPPPAPPALRRGSVPAEDTPFVTDRALAKADRSDRTRRVFDRFSVTDLGWISSLVAMGVTKFRDPHPFNEAPAPTHRMNSRCRLVMVGDWGSGLPRAIKVAKQMRRFVDESVAEGIECHVVHLGDVYYSGWEYEYRDRFLDHWPVHPGEADRVGSWSLNGNHDMYSGGYGYYDVLLSDPRFARQSGSSFFRLANDHWQFMGLDTAYDDDGLRDPQSSWVAGNLGAGNPRAIALTHHQFFSVYENAPTVGAVLRRKLAPALSDGKLFGAIWGHEHRCILHAPHDGLRFGRLLGNGGVPVYMTHAAEAPFPAPAIFEDRRYMANGLERWAYMGFAVLDIDGYKLRARYVDENGLVLRTEDVR